MKYTLTFEEGYNYEEKINEIKSKFLLIIHLFNKATLLKLNLKGNEKMLKNNFRKVQKQNMNTKHECNVKCNVKWCKKIKGNVDGQSVKSQNKGNVDGQSVKSQNKGNVDGLCMKSLALKF